MSDQSFNQAVIEEFLMEHIREKKRARRWSIIKYVLGISVIVLLTVWSAYKSKSSNTIVLAEQEPHIAEVLLHGDLVEEKKFEGSRNKAETIIQNLHKAFSAPSSKAVILNINTNGGSPVMAEVISNEIKFLKERYQKPLYAVVGEGCFSAGYYIAVSADTIYASKNSLIGSIGVVASSIHIPKLLDKIGVSLRVHTAGKDKRLLRLSEMPSPEATARVQTLLDDMHAVFIQHVKLGRQGKLKELDTDPLFTGLVWPAERALALGLIDEIGNVYTVARHVMESPDPKIVRYETPVSVLELVQKKISSLQAGLSVQSMQDLLYSSVPEALKVTLS